MNESSKNILTVCLTTLVMVLLIEGFFYFFPRLLPQDVLLSLPSKRVAGAFGNDTASLVQRLNKAPWLKFHPNALVHDGIQANEVSSFHTEWKTDSLGFKNPQGQTIGKARLVIVGNSHIEGVGVRPADTIAGVLTRDYGIPSYNLGVEGYGPQQSVAAFASWGTAPPVQVAVYAFNGSLHYGAAQGGGHGDPNGRINARARADDGNGLGALAKNSVILAFLKTSYQRVRNWYSGRFGPLRDVPKGDVVPRAAGLGLIWQQMDDVLAEPTARRDPNIDPDMKVNDQQILKFARLARQCGITPVVMILPSVRSETSLIYPYGLPAAWRASLGGNEAAANDHVAAFAQANGIAVADARPRMQAALSRWASADGGKMLDFRQDPFFKIDGHPSDIGQRLYASVLADVMKKLPQAPAHPGLHDRSQLKP